MLRITLGSYWCWLLLVLFDCPTWGQTPPSQDSPPSVTGKTLPTPPWQNKAWKPPASKVPEEFVKAATLLFEQGLADPRGCEYRVIELTNGSRAHGWVLPAKDGERFRFAVCWNGLVYPVASIGDKADLKSDIRESQKPETDDLVKVVGDRELTPRYYGDLSTALLLRLGEADLASEWWAANHPPPAAGQLPPLPVVRDPYLTLAKEWASLLFHEAREAHQDGNDPVALHYFRTLTTFVKAADAEAKKRQNELSFSYLQQLPELLADQERRAKEGPREIIVCIGSGRDPDQKKRIAALVLRLDEVRAIDYFPRNVALRIDPVVSALVREGEPAVEPLVKCIEEDHRLTRLVFSQDGCGVRSDYTCASVQEAAFIALSSILDYSPDSTGKERRKELAASFREHIQKTKGLTPAERWFRELADDRAKPNEWCYAAKRLMEPDRAGPPMKEWSVRSASPSCEKRPIALGESLRGKKAPSVTELLLKRIGQCEAGMAADLALRLAAWEPKAALEPLAELTKPLRQQDEDVRFVEVIQKRHELGDRRALDDYVAFIRTAHPKMIIGWHENLFDPMVEHPNHAGMVKAAAELFADERSPWLPLLQKGDDQQEEASPVYRLVPTRLLRLPAFRNAVLKELGNKMKVGTVQLTKDGKLVVHTPFYGQVGNITPPREDLTLELRTCDWCANLIGERLNGAPQCEVYRTEAERDKAVAACADFLRRHQYELAWRKETVRFDVPATAAQVENGQAVFSLAGEGKEVRVVPWFKAPVPARWIACKDRPFSANVFDRRTGKWVTQTIYEQIGEVVQAEEVLQDGRWRRFYGFIGLNRIVCVPAEEIDFSSDEDETWSTDRRDWMYVGPGLHVRLDVPPLQIEVFDDLPPRLSAEAVLKFRLVVRNSRGLGQPSPDPAKIVKVRLLYSPETISRQGALVPKALRETDWIEQRSKPGAKFMAEKAKMIEATEEMKLATLDLRDWYDMSKPGFYRLQLLPAAHKSDDADAIREISFSLAPPQRKPNDGP